METKRIILGIACLVAWRAFCPPVAGEELHALKPVPIQQVRIDDAFWAPKLKVWHEVTLKDCFDKFEWDGALANFDKIRDGKGGEHDGLPWFDGLVYEMIRASADFLAANPDPKLEARLDGYIERIAAAAARDPNGYLNTYTQMKEPDHRWGLNGGNDRWLHDLYNAGAMVEAGVYYYRATGKTRLLDVAAKLSNHMADVMGPAPRKNIVPGHALGEEALVKLYQLFHEQPQLKTRMSVPVDERRYLELARFWIDARGHHEGRESFGDYNQDGIPVLKQQTIEGHAVRAMLLCVGLMKAGEAAGQPEYLATARRLWDNMVSRRMYLTGGVGAVSNDEKFGPDYFLPNTGYAETCASAAAAFFHHEMNLAFGEARYADELERVLYNGVLAGISESGDHYYYENPLEAGKQHVRWEWHDCPCCPPMFLKVMGSLPGYLYAQDSNGVYVNLYVGSNAKLNVNGAKLALRQETQYPWDGRVKLTVNPERPAEFSINLRLPAWCENPEIRVNGQAVTNFKRIHGYAALEREWRSGDVAELSLPMAVERVYANPKVEENEGRVALRRGPLVYCAEGHDHGGSVRNLVLPPEADLTVERRADLYGGATVLRGKALALNPVDWKGNLYAAAPKPPGLTEVGFTAIPYFANSNREPSEMMVWLAESPSKAKPALPPGLAGLGKPSASHCFSRDTVAALNDQIVPSSSDDSSSPRLTWWDHRGTTEWVQYDFEQPQKVSAVETYWWDERRIGAQCRVPVSWRVLYKQGDDWKPVKGESEWKPVVNASVYGTEMDKFNRVTFTPVTTKSLRVEVKFQPEWSGGLLEWRVE